MQTNVTVDNGKITGTSKFYEGWASGPLKGPGNYIALKFTATSWDAYDSVMVGLNPSQGTGLVEIINDPDKNGVFKITDTETQVLEVICKKGDKRVSNIYSLKGLVLESDEA